MGAVFALASATPDIATARPEAVATGMRVTFAVARLLIVAALAIAASAHVRRAFGLAQPPQPELALAPDHEDARTPRRWRRR